jgi:hypothetical protein
MLFTPYKFFILTISLVAIAQATDLRVTPATSPKSLSLRFARRDDTCAETSGKFCEGHGTRFVRTRKQLMTLQELLR